jgi:diguanylate cyclase (GGDEF)-like protein
MGFSMPAMLDRPGILARIADNPKLPTPPAVALRVLEKAGEPDCTLADLEGIIGLDPLLCVQLLRTVNSALYGLPWAVTSIRLALGLLGTSAVRSLVLSLSLPALRTDARDSDDLRAFWKSSIAGAIVARELALRLGRPGPEDYLVSALLRDLGTLVLPQVFPEASRHLRRSEPAGRAGGPSCEEEEDAYGVNHAEVSAHLLRRWRAPADISEAIRFHKRPAQAPPHTADRARLLHFATKVALFQAEPPNPEVWTHVKALAAEHFGMDEVELLKFLGPLDRKMAEFAALVRVDPGPWQHYPTVLAAAVELDKLTAAPGAEHMRVREQAEQDADYWPRATTRFHREAVRDPLTGCYNRGFFEAALVRTFRRARRRCTALGLLFIDLNNFKTLNDRHGHAFGDHALKSVASRLLSCVRSGDVVARYGGDEFCVITEATTEAGLLSMADRLRSNVARLSLRNPAGPAEARVAVGAMFCLPFRCHHTTDEILATADRAMYEAKRSHGGGVRLTALIEQEDRRFLAQVEGRLFSVFLQQRNRLSARDVAGSPRPATRPLRSLPALARRVGLLSRAELAAILTEQRKSGRPFAEIVLARRALTTARLAGLLALQRQSPEAYVDDLVNRGLLSEEVAENEVGEYYAALRSG